MGHPRFVLVSEFSGQILRVGLWKGRRVRGGKLACVVSAFSQSVLLLIELAGCRRCKDRRTLYLPEVFIYPEGLVSDVGWLVKFI